MAEFGLNKQAIAINPRQRLEKIDWTAVIAVLLRLQVQ